MIAFRVFDELDLFRAGCDLSALSGILTLWFMRTPIHQEDTMPRKLLLGIAAFWIMVCLAEAAEIGGVIVPDTLTVGETQLVLNGAGIRKKFIMKIYVGALYLKQKTNDFDTILAADEPMAIRMHFIYDGVPKERLIHGWNESFSSSREVDVAGTQNQVDAFNACFTENAAKNDVYDFVYEPGKGVTVVMQGEVKAVIPGLDFKKGLFSIWLGRNASNESLKEAMLGG